MESIPIHPVFSRGYYMNRTMRLLVTTCLLLAGAMSSQAGATNYSLWINGRGAGGAAGKELARARGELAGFDPAAPLPPSACAKPQNR